MHPSQEQQPTKPGLNPLEEKTLAAIEREADLPFGSLEVTVDANRVKELRREFGLPNLIPLKSRPVFGDGEQPFGPELPRLFVDDFDGGKPVAFVPGIRASKKPTGFNKP